MPTTSVPDKIPHFGRFYTLWMRHNDIVYTAAEFLHPKAPPWPQPGFDFGWAQAPEVPKLPRDEIDDWNEFVGSYYIENSSSYGDIAAQYAAASAANANGYAPLPDALFAELLCDGLYSKYLVCLTDADVALFQQKITFLPEYEYLKSDHTCMRVIETPNKGMFVAPAVAVFRRLRNGPDRYQYEPVAIALCKWVATKPPGRRWSKPKLVLTPASPGWSLSKYFVLQGASHRITIVEHPRVHFPSDTINALTKTLLPKWHFVQKLLLPHFWLTLGVNNNVLEGARSVINRTTWFPYSPLVAVGAEVRKLMPFSWAGSEDQNDAFPSYRFPLDPREYGCGATNPSNFIGLGASRYGVYLLEYYTPILEFTQMVVAAMPTEEEDGFTWLITRNWAHYIASMVPGFPDCNEIVMPGVLAKTLAMIIWNAAVMHSADHSLMHAMFVDSTKVPVVMAMRVPPPQDDSATPPSVGPLVLPADQGSAKLADLLFFLPHNSSTLYQCEYKFADKPKDVARWPVGRPLLTQTQLDALDGAVKQFRAALLVVHLRYFDETGAPREPWIGKMCLPKLLAGSADNKTSTEEMECLGAGIQY